MFPHTLLFFHQSHGDVRPSCWCLQLLLITSTSLSSHLLRLQVSQSHAQAERVHVSHTRPVPERTRRSAEPRRHGRSCGLTSVTVVLWKVSVLYSQPPWQVPLSRPSSAGPPGLLRFPGSKQASSGRPLRELKFAGTGGPSEDQEERQR